MPEIETSKNADRPCFHFREINGRSKLEFLCSQLLNKLIDNNFQLNLLVQVSPPKANILKQKKKSFSKIFEIFKRKLQSFRKERETKVGRFGLYKVEHWGYVGERGKTLEKTIQTLTQSRNVYFSGEPEKIKENDLLSRSINMLKSRSYQKGVVKASKLQANISSLNFESQSKKESSSFRLRTISSRMQIQAIFSREFPMKQFWDSGMLRPTQSQNYFKSEVIALKGFTHTSSELQKRSTKNTGLEETQIQSKPSLCETNVSRCRARSERLQLKSIRIPVEEHRIFKLKDILTPSSSNDGGSEGKMGGSRSMSRKRLVIPRYSSLDRKKKKRIRSLLGQYVQESQISLVDSKRIGRYPISSS